MLCPFNKKFNIFLFEKYPVFILLGQLPVRITTPLKWEISVLAPMLQRRLLGPGCPLCLRAAQATHFWGHIAPGAMGMLWQHASCPKTAKKRQNLSCHRQTPKCWPKSVGMSKRHGTVQPGAWPSAHTCQQQPQARVCPLQPLGANTSGKTRLTPVGPMAAA